MRAAGADESGADGARSPLRRASDRGRSTPRIHGASITPSWLRFPAPGITRGRSCAFDEISGGRGSLAAGMCRVRPILSAMTIVGDICTREDCERLVRAFHGQALNDPIIGYLFTEIANLDLEAHVPKITAFWETVLLGAHSYRGGAFCVTCGAAHEGAAAARALRALAVAVAHDRGRAVRRRAR